ncbi:MAG: hypothetical protein JWQ56_2131 [Pseudarthrobacter sp.]|nr:hypothetical protein [Pseudarthrobacter sp.]
MLLPSRARQMGLVLACGLAAFGAPAFAAPAEPSGWLEVTAGPGTAMQSLTPGGTAMWPVDVHVPGEPATELEVTLETEPAASDLLRKFLSVELRACSQPWVQGQCGSGERLLMKRTSLSAADGLQASLLEPGSSLSGGACVLLSASLAEDVPVEVQGNATQIAVLVRGSGDDAGTGPAEVAGAGSIPGQFAGPPSGSLADTGAKLGGFAVLGLLAVAVGFGVARLRTAST